MRFALLVIIRLWELVEVPEIDSSLLRFPVNLKLGVVMALGAIFNRGAFLADRQPAARSGLSPVL